MKTIVKTFGEYSRHIAQLNSNIEDYIKSQEQNGYVVKNVHTSSSSTNISAYTSVTIVMRYN